jgi:hypothetical protein
VTIRLTVVRPTTLGKMLDTDKDGSDNGTIQRRTAWARMTRTKPTARLVQMEKETPAMRRLKVTLFGDLNLASASIESLDTVMIENVWMSSLGSRELPVANQDIQAGGGGCHCCFELRHRCCMKPQPQVPLFASFSCNTIQCFCAQATEIPVPHCPRSRHSSSSLPKQQRSRR